MMSVIQYPRGFGGGKASFSSFQFATMFPDTQSSMLAGKGDALAFGSQAFTF